MPFALVRMTRVKSGSYSVRKAIPADVREEYERLYGQRWEAKFTIPAGTPPQEAKAQHAAYLALVETRIQAIRDAKDGRARSLSEREALALAGAWYRWFTGQHEDNPGEPARWANLNFALGELLEGDVGTSDEEGGWIPDPEVWDRLRPVLARESGADRFLADKGLALSQEAYVLFMDRLLAEFINAVKLLERRADGDYSPDKRLQQFPKFNEAPKPHKVTGLTAWALFEAYVAAVQPQASTINRWRSVFLDLDEHFERRAASAISDDDAQAWADGLLNGKRSAVTVNDIWCSSARTVFGWAVKTKKVSVNPFRDTKVTQPRKVRTRETDEFSPEEAKRILGAALTFGDKPKSAFEAARRWVPWLCAYTGARPGEMTQLRGQDVMQQGGIWAIQITPEAGTVKNRKPRMVPLHEHLLDQGFVEFAQAKGQGPLFYNTTSPLKAPKVDPTNPPRSRAVKTRERLADWVRKLGVADKAIRPNHAWRHTFKRRATRARIDAGIRDAICGHSPRTVADIYETPTLEDMAEALKKFPRYEIG
jgi:integrase